MFSSNNESIPPPPPAGKPRNVSMGSALPTYRSRPEGNASFSAARSLFETVKNPETRRNIVNFANNPLVQRTAVAAAKDERVRSAAVSAVKDQSTRESMISAAQKPSNGTILGLAKQFENKPIMRQLPPGASPSRNSDTFSFASFNSSLPTQAPEPARRTIYPSLTAQDPFEYPPQLPSTNSSMGREASSWSSSTMSSSYPHNANLSISLLDYDIPKTKAPPARPPPPKVGSRSNPNLAALCPSPDPVTNEPHAIVKYPYNAAKADELTCKPNDLVLLKKEVDGQWIFALNTRTGSAGIVPLSFLQVKVPLVPTESKIGGVSFSLSDHGLRNHSATAIYDYNSGVDGDLKFNAGEVINFIERVNDEWLKGESGGSRGIFPITFVHIERLCDIPFASMSANYPSASSGSKNNATFLALYDYNSGVAEDLIFQKGDTIEMVNEVNSEWFMGRVNGRTGLVPKTFVQPV